MAPDVDAVLKGTGAREIVAARHLCRSEIERFKAEAGKGGPLVVACTQEAPLFAETAADFELPAELLFANIRETAGWAGDGRAAGPKMAAMIAAAAVETKPAQLVPLKSEGVILIYGRDEAAIEAGQLVADKLDVSVILTKPRDVAPPRRTEFPIAKGTIRNAKGHLGAFEITLDDYALPAASSRGSLSFGPGRNGALSKADIILDLSGDAPLFPAADLRDGYLRADPGSPAAVARACLKAADLIGAFDKPRYIAFREDLCAHSRSKITGCTRCLDLCPTGAISPNGDAVAIDPQICAGCGSCAAACPTGAAAYDYPSTDGTIARIRAMLTAYRAAGGATPVVLFHDEGHGADMIDAAARLSDGLPAHVLPLGVNETTQIGPEVIAAAFAYGAAGVRFVERAKPRHDITGLHGTVDLASLMAEALGYGAGTVDIVETDDPDAMLAALGTLPGRPTARPSSFVAAGGKREVLALAFREMHRVAPEPVDVVALPKGAPFGRVNVNTEGCTLCLACVSACPTSALKDNPEKPMLRFDEAACVQCGLCAATCPEKVITLEPRLDFRAFGAPPVTIKEEEPFHCIECGKGFGTKSTIERVIAKLDGKHWMFSGAHADRLKFLRMCEDCRVQAATNAEIDPYASPRPAPRTTDDYLREREALRRAWEAGEKGEA